MKITINPIMQTKLFFTMYHNILHRTKNYCFILNNTFILDKINWIMDTNHLTNNTFFLFKQITTKQKNKKYINRSILSILTNLTFKIWPINYIYYSFMYIDYYEFLNFIT